MENLITFDNVTLDIGDKTLLSGIDWKIDRGEKWILFGRNGSGKSLLLQILTGYLWPSSGTVTRFGRAEGLDLREMRKHVGYLATFLKNRVEPGTTVSDTVLGGKFASIGLFDRTTAADRKRASELMELTGCAELASRTFGTLSDGEKERTLIARSLMPLPELLVLDEPCAGLDIRGREEFLATLAGITNKMPEMAVVLVTHHADEISPEFGKVLMLKKGKVFRKGTTDECIDSEAVSSALDFPVEIVRRDGRFWSLPGADAPP